MDKAFGTAGYTAANTALVGLLSTLLPGLLNSLGVSPQASHAVIDWAQSHSSLLPLLYTTNPFTASLPWLTMMGATALGSTDMGQALPVLGQISKAVQGMAAARMGAGSVTGTLANQLALSAISALFHLDKTAAAVALGAAGYSGWLASAIASWFLPSGLVGGALKGVVALVPMAVAAFLVTMAMLMYSPWAAHPHGFSTHTLAHAAGVAMASAVAATAGIAPGLSSLVQPATAVAAFKAMQKLFA